MTQAVPLNETSSDYTSAGSGTTPQKANGVIAAGNGVTRPCNGKITSNGNTPHGGGGIQVCCPEGVEQWKDCVSQIAERCDLSGLATNATQYQLASTGLRDANDVRNMCAIPLPADVQERLKKLCLVRSITMRSVVLFAVHQMLKGFGGGSHTVTASVEVDNSDINTGPSCAVSPMVICHQNKSQSSVAQEIQSIEQMRQNPGQKDIHHIETASSLINMGLMDIPIIFSAAEKFQVPFAGFPLVVIVREHGAKLEMALHFSDSLFSQETIINFADGLNILLAEAASGGAKSAMEIELLSAEQRQQLERWNDTDGDYAKSKRLNHLIEEAAELHEDRVAIVYKGRQLTYGELNAEANRFAHYLRSTGIQTEQLVALFLEKTENLLVTILGIWKSGAAYVPIDPTYPDERVRFVLDDTKANIVICSDQHADRLQRYIVGDRELCIIHLEPCLRLISQEPWKFPSQNLEDLSLTSKQLAYVTYTSGTTGFPKGILKQHTNVVNSITDLSDRYGVTGNHHECILLFSAYVFEPFVRQMLMALVNGHLLAVIDDREKYDADKLISFIREHRVTYLNGTASVLQECDFSCCPSLKRLILVGENLTEARYLSLRRRFQNRILNEYGFTESAFVTALNVFERGATRKNMSLGRPVRNVKCYILNPSLKRVSIGATGELHIGGLGISKGYHNRPDLTPQRFIPNPFQTDREKELGTNTLMYKTGDLARWLPNGEIEYLGRADFQIKLRGIRIEPGEIESTLADYPGIRTSLVVSKRLRNGAKETENEHLVAYYVCDNTPVLEADLVRFLELQLPRYMIPTRLVQLPQIPVTVNGKADLRALPAIDVIQPRSVSSDLKDDMEAALGKIWADVLGTTWQSISRKDSFFRLGGHSITCIQLIARIRQQLGLNISIEDVFASRELGQMAGLLRTKQREPSDDSRDRTSQTLSRTALGELTNDDAYVANSLQQGFVYQFLKCMGRSDAYIMQNVVHYNAALLPDLYQRAWKHVQHTIPSLRLRFQWGQDVLQIVDKDQALNWKFLRLTNLPATAETERLLELQSQDRATPYALEAGNLFRIYLIQHSPRRFTCLFSCHHSILDGWSLPLLFEKLHGTYLDLLHGEPIVRSVDESYSQSQRYIQAHREDHVEYWTNIVAQIGERCDMNSLLNERSRYKIQLAGYDQVCDQQQLTLTVSEDDSLAELRQTCSAQGITLHSILQFVWHAVLHAYGGGTHTVTGTTISGRNIPISGIERSIGLYINTLPLVVDHSAYKNKTIMEVINDVQARVNAMNSRGNVELGRLRKGDLKHGLFDSLFVLENYPNLDRSQELRHQSELRYSIESGLEKLDYPLAVIARETKPTHGFTFTICYARELFDEMAISELLHMVEDTVFQVAKHLNDPVSSLEYLSCAQLDQLATWNATEADFPDSTLHAMFEMEAARKPDKVAVVYEERQLTYRQLNERANRMAHRMNTEVHPKPNSIIALVMDKSEHMITSIVAVWKTGGAYVPIDPGYPDDRIRYILEDTGAIAIIADSCYHPRIRGLMAQDVVLYSSDMLETPDGRWSVLNPEPSSGSRDLAYIIYTSGTTGRPKGVMVEHHGVVNLQVSLSKIFGLRDTDDEVILSFSNYVFDHFVEQMTDAILNGQTLVVLNDEMRGDKERLYRYIERNRVTYLSGTPSVVSMYEFSRFKDHLRRVDCVGEAFSEPVFDQIRQSFHGLIINGYGPTEVSITTNKRLYPFPERRTDKSIGAQVHNSTSYVLNDDMKRIPIGAVGELYLGGEGVARGYHNRPDVTAERFILNPFQTEEERHSGRNGRLYRTGDLVSWIPGSNGEVEYLGRNDFQVKIRGLRIELGEIEAVLSSHPDVKQSVVIAKDGKDSDQKFLVGYYVVNSAVSSAAIRRFMQSRLPGYMVPSGLIPITSLPVTPSGKLDTKSLPPADEVGVTDAVAPQNEIETTLCSIWAELLGMPPHDIGRYSDFFNLGGDSLKSTSLSFKIYETFNRTISVAAVFRHRTIEALAHLIMNNAADIHEVTPVDYSETDKVPISRAQERLVFIHELEGACKAYNIDAAFELPGSIDSSRLEQALLIMLSRHEALRTLLNRDQRAVMYFQRILTVEEARVMATIKNYGVGNKAEIDQEIKRLSQHVFRLDSELPWLAHIVRHQGGNIFLILSFHHTCFDAWSMGIFMRELRELCAPSQTGVNVSAAPAHPKVQYKEYAEHHRRRLNDSLMSELSEFWLQRLSGLEPLQLVTDHTRPARFRYDGDDIAIDLDNVVLENLRSIAKSCNASLFAVMLSAYCLLLSAYANQTDVAVGVPVSHRTHPLFQSVIGFFVNLIVLRVDVSNPDIHGLIKTVMRGLVDAQLHRDMPFQDVTKLLGVENDTSRHPLVQTVFNFESDPEGDQDAPSAYGDVVEMAPYQPAGEVNSIAKFDLNATVTEFRARLRINFNYATSLFRRETIEGLLNTYVYFLGQLSELGATGLREGTKLSQVRPVEDGAVHLPLKQSRASPGIGGSEAISSLSKAFEYEAARLPNRTAVVQGNMALTYAELNERANQLAQYVQRVVGIGAEDKVALLLEKSIDMIICILAVWKAGGAYVPLDPTYPAERIELILQDTGAKALLTESQYATGCDSQDAKVIAIDSTEIQDLVNQEPVLELPTTSTLDNLAYVIFTSGTSGKPKGVLVEQRGVLRLRDALRQRYFGAQCPEAHGVLFLSNYVFDFSVEQLVLSVLSGNRLIIPVGDFVMDDGFYRTANAQGLSYLSGTPSLLQQIDLDRLEHLRVVTAAGEELHATQYQRLRDRFRGPIYNAYGITETTVYNIITEFTSESKFENALRELLPGTRAYLLNSTLQPVPFHAVGELYLSGDCLARGYLNQPLLTEQRFVSNPFRNENDIANRAFPRLYKTGDLIRGYRIEVSEVQSVLASCPGVAQCAVLARSEHGNSQSRSSDALIGYYTSDGEAMSNSSIFDFMKARLPAYMLPSVLCHVDGALPVTINGKLDVRRLPDISRTTDHISYSPPRNVLEAKMCILWASALGMERCGIDDDLFKLGGDSITSLHLVALIHDRIGRKVTVRDIFDHRSIRGIHDFVLMNSASSDDVPQFRTEQQLVVGDAPLLPIQSWFLSKRLHRPGQWNHTFSVRTPELDVSTLNTAVTELQLYHDAFRMRLRQRGSSMVQYFPDDCSPVQLRVLNVNDVQGRMGIGQVLSDWQSGFDLQNGPVCAFAYVHGYADRSARVWFSVHHMSIDTVSWQILSRDLQTLYHGGSLGNKSSSIRQWAQAVQKYQATTPEREHWESLLLKIADNTVSLPPSTGSRIQLSRAWSNNKTAVLLRGVNSAQDLSMQDYLLAAVGLALQSISPSSPSMVTIEGHGREEAVDKTLNLSRTMGWCTSMYPFEIPPLTKETIMRGLISLRKNLDKVPNRGVGFGALYGYSEHPMPQVTVNYLGQLTTKAPTTGNWVLEVGDGDMEYGLTTSPADKGQSSFAVDITAICTNGSLKVSVDSSWSAEDSALFMSQIEEGLDIIIDAASGQHTDLTPTAPKFTEETYTPYFEYLDASRRGPILFLLPPGEGGAESYFNNIVRHLPRANMVVFNNYYLHTKRLTTFESLAAMYLEHVRQFQSDGPYHFIGWSFGGILAMEMSRLLLERGANVGLLGIIDTYFNVRGATRTIGLGDREILDPIHHIYQPDPANFQCLAACVDRIVLFKATRTNDKYQSDNQKLLYEYYARTRLNDLDSLLPSHANINLVPLVDDTHFSWASNPRQVAYMCSIIEEILAHY
ncbi:non-ribosomal peptide synthetase [Aspergillus puulaauensis]|uniref:Non-ribosomal peptide synthetase n=1 Tax=Aspergillus puulaauensis TaxID=1220207 RepID=A0A7R7XE58_9EURO|nr:non-ribosomal peptide synthetase [Aspergillus puulaauensis]BCS19536.1 non-ribosomal peptide synthetase [Aspergillus puulaauensis]